MSDEDSRQEEADHARRETAGQHHRVTVQVTIKADVTLPGSSHTQEDLDNCLQEVLDNGEVVEIEEL